MDNCLFCKIINGEVPSHKIYENEYVYAFLDIFPNADGHTLVIPKKHFENYAQTEEIYLKEIAVAKKLIAKQLEEKLSPVGFNFVSNMGSEAFQVVFHYHEHIIPKYVKDDGYKPTVNKVNLTDDLSLVLSKIMD